MQWVLWYEQDCKITFTMNEECFIEVLYLKVRKLHFSKCLRILGIKRVSAISCVYFTLVDIHVRTGFFEHMLS